MAKKKILSKNIHWVERVKFDFQFMKGVIILGVGLLQLACDNRQPSSTGTESVLTHVSIAVSTTPLSAPFYIAEAKGYFKEQGLDAKFIDTIGGHRCLKKVLAGEADMGTVSDYPVMIQGFKRNDYAIVATFVSSDNDVKLIANHRKGIKQPADLRNKKIGTVIGSSSHYFLDRFLLFNNMSLSDVSVKHVNPEEQPAALKRGDVDALSVWEPYAYLAKNNLQKESIIFPAGEYYRETFNLVIKKDFIKNNTDMVRKVLLALTKAIDFIRNQPDAAQKLLVTRLKLDDEFIDWIWKDYEFDLTMDQSLIITLENEARWAIKNGVVKQNKMLNFLDYIDSSIIKNIDGAQTSIIQ